MKNVMESKTLIEPMAFPTMTADEHFQSIKGYVGEYSDYQKAHTEMNNTKTQMNDLGIKIPTHEVMTFTEELSYEPYYKMLVETNADYDLHYTRHTANSVVIGVIVPESDIRQMQTEITRLKEELQLRADYASECRALLHERNGLQTDVKLLNNIIAKRDEKIKEIEEQLHEAFGRNRY